MSVDLLGGAVRGRTRPRGFIEWKPGEATLKLLGQVRQVLEEYDAYLPMTLRQIYYRLIGAHGYPKDDKAYERLGELLNKARRARMIPMDVMRDGGGTRDDPESWEDAEHYLRAVRRQAETLRLDRSTGQDVRLVVMCEAAGMVEQLASVARDYGVPVISSGGFESVTEKYAFAKELAADGRETEVLHIGDHDPSGAHMFIALLEDIEAFCDEMGGDVTFTRLAVTPEQIIALGLETSPKKRGDGRAFNGETCQCEAIAPDVLSQIVKDAIEDRIDQEAFDDVCASEVKVRKELCAKLA
jgi:hypothetical protein